MTEAPTRPDLPFLHALLPVGSLIVLVALSFYLFGDAGMAGPNQVALTLAAMVAVLVARRHGYSASELRDAAVESVGSGMGAIFILFAVGALIGTWAMSGTLVAMVYYGLKILDPNYFYVSAVAICAVVSFGIGSSWTTVGTVGIGLVGIAVAMGLDPAIAAGAVISGAYFGDTTSPLSDSANLAAGVAGVDLYVHIRETLPVSLVALLVAAAGFWAFGQPAAFSTEDVGAVIRSQFNVSPILFLPLLVVVVLAVLKVPAFTTILVGALLGGVMAVIMAPDRVETFAAAHPSVPYWLRLVKGVWLALAHGYTSTTGVAALDDLASRGGMASMLNTIWLVITAFAFGGIAEKAGMLQRMLAPVMAVVSSAFGLVVALVGSIMATAVATADQYLAVLLPGRMFAKPFAEKGLSPLVLSRSVASAATPTSALIPWNSCGAYMAATLGVSTFSYAPYAFFNMASPLLAIAMAGFGIRMIRRDPA